MKVQSLNSMALKYTYKVKEITATPRTGRILEGAVNAVKGSAGVFPGGSVTVNAEFDIVEGEGISIEKSAEENLSYTISHGNTSEGESTANQGMYVVKNVFVDTFGHVTGFE